MSDHDETQPSLSVLVLEDTPGQRSTSPLYIEIIVLPEDNSTGAASSRELIKASLKGLYATHFPDWLEAATLAAHTAEDQTAAAGKRSKSKKASGEVTLHSILTRPRSEFVSAMLKIEVLKDMLSSMGWIVGRVEPAFGRDQFEMGRQAIEQEYGLITEGRDGDDDGEESGDAEDEEMMRQALKMSLQADDDDDFAGDRPTDSDSDLDTFEAEMAEAMRISRQEALVRSRGASLGGESGSSSKAI